MKKIIFAVLFIAFLNNASAQAPLINSWVINTTGATGYNNIVKSIQYAADKMSSKKKIKKEAAV